jgi:hypothetical protein
MQGLHKPMFAAGCMTRVFRAAAQLYVCDCVWPQQLTPGGIMPGGGMPMGGGICSSTQHRQRASGLHVEAYLEQPTTPLCKALLAQVAR